MSFFKNPFSVASGVATSLVKVATNVAIGTAESFAKNVLMDTVKPVRGCIAKVELWKTVHGQEDSEHTGIYVSNNQLIELKNDDRIGGTIVKVTEDEFLNSSKLRSGAFIYIACYKQGDKVVPFVFEEGARNAERQLRNSWNYNLMSNNCHRFTAESIYGEKINDRSLFGLDTVENAISQVSGIPRSEITWRSVKND